MPNAMLLAISPFELRKRGEVLGWWGMIASAGSLVGPTLGGFLTENFGWHSIFYVNLPFAVAILILGLKYIPSTAKNQSTAGFDYPGSIYLIVSLVALLLGITI